MKQATILTVWVFVILLLAFDTFQCAAVIEPEDVRGCVRAIVIDHRFGRKRDYFLVQMPDKRVLPASAGSDFPPAFRGDAVVARFVGRWTQRERLVLTSASICSAS